MNERVQRLEEGLTTPEQDDWVRRVLGVSLHGEAAVEPDAVDEDAADFAEWVVATRRRIEICARASAPAAADMAAHLERIEKLIAASHPSAPAEMAILEDALYVAETVESAGKVAPEIRIPLTLRKLMIEWRAAQSAADTGIRAIGAAYLIDEEVQEDPRSALVYDTVKELPSKIPAWGESLGDAVDALFNDGGKTPSVLQQSLKVVTDYRTKLDAVPMLARLEALAKEEYGTDFRVYTPLVEALDKIESALRAIA
jgi:hypothetical protein